MDTRILEIDNSYSSQVVDLILTIQQKEFGVAITVADQPDLLTIDEFYKEHGGNFWGAFVDEQLVGTIALIKFGNHKGAIRKMFVKKEFRGKELQIAQQLFDVLVAYCKEKGIEELYLGTVDILKAAHRFYERNGFSKLHKMDLPHDFPLMQIDDTFFGIKLGR